MTLDQAFDYFNAVAQDFANPKAIAGNLTRDLDNLAYQMRRLAPIDSGRLRSSIALTAKGRSGQLDVVLQMLDYGLYQNYGVGPTAQSPFRASSAGNTDRRQPYGVVVEGSTLGDYMYSHRNFGLPATVFFDYNELLNQIAILAEEGIFEAINDTE